MEKIIILLTMIFLVTTASAEIEQHQGFPVKVGDELQIPVVVQDINGDGQLEIIAVPQNRIVKVFNHNGTLNWENTGGKAQYDYGRVPLSSDLNGDNRLEILSYGNPGWSDATFHIWDAAGNNLSYFKVGKYIVISSPAITSDGTILTGAAPGTSFSAIVEGTGLHAFNSGGTKLWYLELGKSVNFYAQIQVADLDADGTGEAVILTQNMNEVAPTDGAAADRLIPDPAGDGVAHADVVIEAIFENVEAKHALFRTLEPRMKQDAVLATNTSSLRLEDLRPVLQRPERLVAIHFFNPVSMMPLVEVVEAEGADPAAVQAACAFVKQIDKLPLPVKSAPGFLVNAVLAPYMLAAMQAVDEGIAPEVVDEAMLAFGMPMGPIELIDTVGLDIAMAAGKQLAGGAEAPKCLLSRVEKNMLGKKSGQGFYDWSSGKAAKGQAGAIPVGLAQRLVKPLLDRTERLVADGVVYDADLADAGVIFGTGFAPFTGGPLNYRATAE
jgi:3-hydroxyacyl-CoA dehydrogenase